MFPVVAKHEVVWSGLIPSARAANAENQAVGVLQTRKSTSASFTPAAAAAPVQQVMRWRSAVSCKIFPLAGVHFITMRVAPFASA